MSEQNLILLPGMPLDAALWAHQTRHLADVAAPQGPDLSGDESIAARLPQTPANPPRATKWKKGKAGKASHKPTGVAVKIRKHPAAKPVIKPKKRR